MQSPSSDSARGEPEHSREEAECDSSLPLLAVVRSRVIEGVEVPSARVAAASWKPINKETEGNNPQDKHNKVERPEGESPCHWQEKKDGEEKGEACNNFGVDETLSWASANLVSSAELMADETSNDGG